MIPLILVPNVVKLIRTESEIVVDRGWQERKVRSC